MGSNGRVLACLLRGCALVCLFLGVHLMVTTSAQASAGWGLHYRQGIVSFTANPLDRTHDWDVIESMDMTILGVRGHVSPLCGVRLGSELSTGANRQGRLTYGGVSLDLAVRLGKADLFAGVTLGAGRGNLPLTDTVHEGRFGYFEPGLGFRYNLKGGTEGDAAFGLKVSYWQPLMPSVGEFEWREALPWGNLGLTFEMLTGRFFP